MDQRKELPSSSAESHQQNSLFKHSNSLSSCQPDDGCLSSGTEALQSKNFSINRERCTSKSEESKLQTEKRNSDFHVSKDTSKLLRSDSSENCHSAFGSFHHNHPSHPTVSLSRLHLNIKVLYGLFACLAAIFVCSGVLCTLHIWRLRKDLDIMNDIMDEMRKNAPSSEEMSRLANFLHRLGASDQSQAQTDKARFWGTVLGEVKRPSSNGTRDELGGRRKRRANDGASDDWTWMSTFVRVPVRALKAYCQQAKTYCNAKGPRGAPGEKGDKGEKGDSMKEMTYNGRVMRGAAGPKGDRGEPGPRGPEGRMGATGRHGQDGSQGPPGAKGEKGDRGFLGRTGAPGAIAQKGDRGKQGPKGDRGIGGIPGVPGMKGLKGNRGSQGLRGYQGPPGEKGDAGYCEVFQCVDIEQPTEAPVQPGSTASPTLPPIARECSVAIIGKPVFMGSRQKSHGAWMLDAAGQGGRDNLGKVWLTYGTEGSLVWQFSDMGQFKKNSGGKASNLSGIPYFGTGHKVHNGFFYYHWKGGSKIVRFDLARGEASAVRVLPDLMDTSSPEARERAYLYSSRTTVVDFHIDRNGLWAVYIRNSTGKVVASLLDKETLDVKATVALDDLAPRSRGGAFIVCGKLYTVRHHDRLRSNIDGVLDLWQDGKLHTMHIKFNIPYGQNAMISYNFRLKEILAWDSGKQLSYPLLLK